MIKVTQISAGRVAIEGDASVHNVDVLYERLEEVPREAGRLTLDLSGLTELDAIGMQVLLAFMARWESATFENAPPSVQQLIDAGLLPSSVGAGG